MTHPDDQPVTVDFTGDELREWLTAGSGAGLTAEQLGAAELPAAILPPPGTPVTVMRNLRVPWDIDEAVKAAADTAGVSVSEWMREAVIARLAAEPAEPDPAVELRVIVAAATRALDSLPRRQAA